MCGRPAWEAGSDWPAKRILDHRMNGSKMQYLVEWDGEEAPGKPWDNSWHDEESVGSFHVRVYTRRLVSIESKMVTVDMKPIMYTVRKSVAHAVALAKTKVRPTIHFMPIEVLNLEVLGMAFLEMVQRPGKLNLSLKKSERMLPIKKAKGDDGFITYSVIYEKMEDIAAFAQFEHFLTADTGTGALRYKLGRKSNLDMMVVGMPLEFMFTRNKAIEGMGSFVISFPTAHINGMYGKVQPPQFGKNSKAMLKQQENINLLVEYIKKTIPDEHPLVAKGWRELPRGRTMLTDAVAVPS